ncbi:MAG: WG repeat-containing protein [Deltaproteobacteria bacterium]|nr:WG repeat-containing protein [Deltaproteobacteria bacterium]
MRAAWLILVWACGGKTAPAPPANVGRGDLPPKATVEDCEPRSSGWKPGNHDRVAFEDPKTNKHGYKDRAGNIVIPAIYHAVYEFSPHGLAGVVADVKAGSPFQFIDPSGKPLARAYAFDNGPDYFQEGYARIVDDAKRVGYIDEKGTITIAPKFVSAAPFCRGKAEVELDDGTFFIDKQGKKTTAPTPDTGATP